MRESGLDPHPAIPDLYQQGVTQREYQPDFVAETPDCIYMLEPKARNEMEDSEVLAKKEAAVIWCSRASPCPQQRRQTLEVCTDPCMMQSHRT